MGFKYDINLLDITTISFECSIRFRYQGPRVRRRAFPDWDKRNEKALPITKAPG